MLNLVVIFKKSFSNLTRTPNEHPFVIVGCWRAEKNWKKYKKIKI
jgi:hypothetical protein